MYEVGFRDPISNMTLLSVGVPIFYSLSALWLNVIKSALEHHQLCESQAGNLVIQDNHLHDWDGILFRAPYYSGLHLLEGDRFPSCYGPHLLEGYHFFILLGPHLLDGCTLFRVSSYSGLHLIQGYILFRAMSRHRLSGYSQPSFSI
jgi:hypothetical protein